MTPNTRKALYGLIPAVVTLLTVYGVLTSNLAVQWANVATLTIGFGYAASRATGHRFGDPEVRRALYVLVPASVALVGGYVSLDVGLWTSLVMAVLGAGLAGLNVDPDEQAGAGDGLDIINGRDDESPRRMLRVVATVGVMVLAFCRRQAISPSVREGGDSPMKIKRIIAAIAASLALAIPVTAAAVTADPISNAWRGGYGDWPV